MCVCGCVCVCVCVLVCVYVSEAKPGRPGCSAGAKAGPDGAVLLARLRGRFTSECRIPPHSRDAASAPLAGLRRR